MIGPVIGERDEVLDQWDDIEDTEDLFAAMDDAILVAADHGAQTEGRGVFLHVVPCVPEDPITAGARVTGIKVARIEGAIGIYLFAEPAA